MSFHSEAPLTSSKTNRQAQNGLRSGYELAKMGQCMEINSWPTSSFLCS